MKRALPTNSMCFINGDERGMSLLSASPVMKAPRIPSIPASSMRPAPMKSIAITKIYCMMPSLYLRKKNRAMRGKMKTITNVIAIIFNSSAGRNHAPASPLYIPPITASTNSVRVSVTMVPPTAKFTQRSRERP